MSAGNPHRDIRAEIFTALDLLSLRIAVCGQAERNWLDLVRDSLNAAITRTTDAERVANQEAKP